ncbi:MAG: winged helix-turn-helix domain-containing protein [Pseudomonadota bacterium]
MAEQLQYDEQRRTIGRVGAEARVVRAKSFAVFMSLARAYPAPVSKEALIAEVWGAMAVSDDSITQCIADIRRALADKDHALIQTRSGHGYALMVPAVAMRVLPETETIAGRRWRLKPRIALFAAACLLGVAVVLGLWLTSGDRDTVSSVDKPMVAVLAFDLVSDSADLTPLAQGLQNDLTVALSTLNTVSVLAPTVLSGEAEDEAPLRAYAALGARFVVDGTIQESGGALRISGQLVDTETSQITWVRTWDGATTDLRALQDRVVAAVADELANPWSGVITGFGSGLAEPIDGDTASVSELIARGAKQFEAFDPRALSEAEQLFRMALEKAADNADAWSGLSFVLGARIPLASADEAKALRDARANAGRQAYHLGESAGRSLLAGSWTAALRGNRSEVVRRLDEAAAKLGADADGLALAALHAALTTERYGDAIAWSEQAQALRDPPPAWYALGAGYAHIFRKDYAKALDVLRAAPDRYAPTLALLTALLHQQGETAASREAAAKLFALYPDFAAESYLRAELFYPEDKRSTLRRLLRDTGLLGN